jgi:NADH dehydrogenase [ubiquinone] 1 alpha subcomplex assembly factor 5
MTGENTNLIPEIFDRTLLRQRTVRVAANADAHSFLLVRIADDMIERLSAIHRTFSLGVDLGARQGHLGRRLLSDAAVAALISIEAVGPLLTHCAGCCIQGEVDASSGLPVTDESADLVTSALNLHLVNDLPGALIQVRRLLKPDGLFLGALLGGATLTELRQAFLAAETECEGGASPRVAPFADVKDLGGLLQRAGFALPVADTDVVTVTYASPLHLMRDLRGMGATNPLSQRRRTFLRRKTLLRACEIYQERFANPDGRIRATFEIITLTGWAPHPDQQKPLKPGSATMRLSDALSTKS